MTPWTAACQTSLSFTITWSLLKFVFIELVMQSNHLILCCLLLLLPSIFPASESFPMSQLFKSHGQCIGASVSPSVLSVNIQVWYSLGLTGFSSGHVWMSELDCEKGWAPKNWCWRIDVVLEKTLESLLDCKEIQPVHPKQDQSWVFIGKTDAEAETPKLWPPHAKSWLT